MIQLLYSVELQYEIEAPGADFIFNLESAKTARQQVLNEQLRISQNVATQVFTDPVSLTRFFRLKAEAGALQINYQATVELEHYLVEPSELAEIAIEFLPPSVLTYLYPSRYCQSDRLINLVHQEFGLLAPGYGRVLAIQSWVRAQVKYQHNSSNSLTSAIDTLNDGVGVCRDFAHLMIALCRALNIPARFATGVDYGANPAFGAPDFHAYVEVYLSHAWYIFDPTANAIPMGFIRIGTGRDAADVAFAMIFGSVSSSSPLIKISSLAQKKKGQFLPFLGVFGISTDTAFCDLGQSLV